MYQYKKLYLNTPQNCMSGDYKIWHVIALQSENFLFAINNFISCAVSCMKDLGPTVIVACIQYIV